MKHAIRSSFVAALCLLAFAGQASRQGSAEAAPDGFVLVPGGSFLMGSSGKDSYEDEAPEHDVTISPFLMAVKEVAQEDFLALMGYNPSFFRGAGLPVDSVSWYDACAYCNSLSDRDGLEPAYRIEAIERGPSGSIRHAEVAAVSTARGYRLPTEAEWEWAAMGAADRGESSFAGSAALRDSAWFLGNAGSRSHLIARKAPNALGIYDLSGNVAEWCWDWYGPYGGAAANDPLGPDVGRERTLRGGSWQDSASSLRAKSRASRHPDFFGPTIGFRPVLPYAALESLKRAALERASRTEPSAAMAPPPSPAATPSSLAESSHQPAARPEPSEQGSEGQLGLKRLLALAVSIRDEASLVRFEEAIDGLDKAGLDELQALLESEATKASAEGRPEPGLRLALSATYGRKGLAAKAYEQILAAEEEAKAPGLSFSMSVLYGRKALLSFAAPESEPKPEASPEPTQGPTPSGAIAQEPRPSATTAPIALPSATPAQSPSPSPALSPSPAPSPSPISATLSRMMSLPGGSFTMGDTAGSGAPDEKPLHTVRVSPFAIGTHEVTREEFIEVMGYDPSPGSVPGAPATMVSWYDAAAYCAALSYREGLEPYYWFTDIVFEDRSIVKAKVTERPGAKGYRLPTEAEWEYAAKGGVASQALAWPGSASANSVAWHSGNSGQGSPHPVCQKEPNEFGLYDMAGNAAEWCSDWFGAYAGASAADPKGPGSGSARAVRGGSCASPAQEARSSARSSLAPETRGLTVGFRVARPYPSSSAQATPLEDAYLPEFILVPSGSFSLGDTAGGGEADERPVHETRLSAFQLGRTELTVGDFAAFVEATGYATSAELKGRSSVYEGGSWIDKAGASWRNPGFEQVATDPVVCVSWYDAVAYCNWRSSTEGFAPLYSYEGSGTDVAGWPEGWNTTTHAKIACTLSGYGYRLPTEAEWEYAAKGGAARQAMPYSGSRTALEVAWHADGGFGRPATTAIKKWNELGFHDMSGNVNEWCGDWYGSYAKDAATDPAGPASGLYKVLRGGGWAQPAAYQRVSDRSSLRPWHSSSMDGFRVLRSGPLLPMRMIQGGKYISSTRAIQISSYSMSATEITQGQYRMVMGSNPAKGFGEGERHPVYNVSWYDALVFCNRLSIIEGLTPCYSIKGSTKPQAWGPTPMASNSVWDEVILDMSANGYRLPTETEWEYAARGGDPAESFKYSGSAVAEEVGWFKNNAGGSSKEVAKLAANRFGIYDMSGNITEWCWDWMGTSDSALSDPTGPRSGTERVHRGGSWASLGEGCDIQWKSQHHPAYRDAFYGFRVVRRP